MCAVRTGFELRMELNADVERMLRDLDGLDELAGPGKCPLMSMPLLASSSRKALLNS